MDALRSAGRAIIRSPSVAKQSWTAGRHRKLPENWTDTRETILEGMTFNLRHLGMTLVDQPKGEDLSAAAVKRIMATAKAGGKKPQKVSLKVSPQGIVLYDSLNNKLLENVSIYRISYCTVDKLHDKVFAYIAQNTLNGTLECHAYLCSKRKVAQAVALTVAQAFTVAFELWQVAREEVAIDNLLGFEASGNVVEQDQLDNHRSSETNNNPAWELEDGLDEAFSRLAVSRTNPQVLDTGVTPQDWHTEPEPLDSNNGNTPCGLSPFRDDIFGF
ncbi:low density lipoprotein receptor adapter protein 1a isoform X4 [Mastacembelus armatus]|uniref:low density lipoprotein receptor adapter protein 1a isoform X4 n=1 Tax=Mastacembelus armatus TaxID=205130 RepID=UPI000E45F32D|nr:low density lipoprotein receptor adapter protein 1-B-like isoform X4 [Mastacembelus armatus]